MDSDVVDVVPEHHTRIYMKFLAILIAISCLTLVTSMTVDVLPSLSALAISISVVMYSILSRSILVTLMVLETIVIYILGLGKLASAKMFETMSTPVVPEEGVPSSIMGLAAESILASIIIGTGVLAALAFSIYNIIRGRDRSGSILRLAYYGLLDSVSLNTVVGLAMASISIYLSTPLLSTLDHPVLVVNALITLFLLLALSSNYPPSLYFVVSLLAPLSIIQPALIASILASIPLTYIQLRNTDKNLGKAVKVGEIHAVFEKSPHPITKLALSKRIECKWDWSLPPQKLPLRIPLTSKHNPHIVIVGESGSGKSSSAASIIASLWRFSRRLRVIIIDPHGEYAKLLDPLELVHIDLAKKSINPLTLAGQPPSQRAQQLSELVRELYRLGPLQTQALYEAIIQAYNERGIVDEDPSTWSRQPPTLADVAKHLRKLESLIPSSRTLYHYLRDLQLKMVSEEQIDLNTILASPQRIVVFDLSRLATYTSQILVTETILRLIDHYIRSQGFSDTIRYIVLVDEAHRLIRKNTNLSKTLARMVAELRKYGVSFILIAQTIKDADPQILANTSIKMVLRLSEPENVDYVSEMLAATEAEQRKEALKITISRLPKGYLVAVTPQLSEPVIAKLLPPPHASQSKP